MITIIVATDKNNLIGKQGTVNGMPWVNKEDLKHYRETTLNHATLMGRKTYEAIGRPLPKRHTIVLTQSDFHDERVEVRHDLKEVIQEYRDKEENLYICGGASIYKQAISLVDTLLISRIPGDYSGDAYFPSIPDYFELQETIHKETFDLEVYKNKGL